MSRRVPRVDGFLAFIVPCVVPCIFTGAGENAPGTRVNFLQSKLSNRQGMASEDVAKLIGVTIVLGVGLSIIIALSFKASVLASWDESRCSPGVIALSALFKPDGDPRTGAEFAKDNWTFCQKQYVESAIRVATTEVRDLADSQSAVVDITSNVIDGISKTFIALWSMCHQAFAMIMGRFTTAAKLFRNMMNQMYAMVDRLQGIVFSISMALVSLIMTMIDTVQVTLMVAVIIIGIILVLQIILFYIFAPISGLIITVSSIIMASVVVATTAISAAMIDNACFTGDTTVLMMYGLRKRIDEVVIGDVLADTGRVTATHRFRHGDDLYNLHGVRVTGDHLIQIEGPRLIPVRQHPGAVKISAWIKPELFCLTTSTRRIPVQGDAGPVLFTDWEEIDGDDTESQEAWYRGVWRALNGTRARQEDVADVLKSEAGISPDCLIFRKTLLGRELVRACDIRIGDDLDGCGRVIGLVSIDGKESDSFVELPTRYGMQVVSCATWIHQAGVWRPPSGFYSSQVRPAKMLHFYTESGQIMLGGVWSIRDASDVGMDFLRQMVEDVVL